MVTFKKKLSWEGINQVDELTFLQKPGIWRLSKELRTLGFLKKGQLDIEIYLVKVIKFPCPSFGQEGCEIHDTRERMASS